MRLTVLADNHTLIDRYYLGEPAFSCLLFDGAHTILFDAGYSDVFLQNADKLSLDLSRVTDIVLSHGHNDHTGGLSAFFSRFTQPVTLYAHPMALLPKRLDGENIGIPDAAFPPWVTVVPADKPVAVSEHALLLGEIPRRHAFETGREIGETKTDAGWVTDTLVDDTSLALLREGGAPFLLTGCAHSGVCNTLDCAARAANAVPTDILGGMHLFDANDAFFEAMDYLKACGVRRVYPAHCTSLAVKAAMFRYFTVCEIGAGSTIEL